MRILPALLILALSGCSSQGHFYAGVGAGYKLDADWHMQPENAGGRNPTANFVFGHEWTYNDYHAARCEVTHWSHWRDGEPFNDRPETHKDEAGCWYIGSFGYWSK